MVLRLLPVFRVFRPSRGESVRLVRAATRAGNHCAGRLRRLHGRLSRRSEISIRITSCCRAAVIRCIGDWGRCCSQRASCSLRVCVCCVADATPPTVVSITALDSQPSSLAAVRFRVVFSEVGCLDACIIVCSVCIAPLARLRPVHCSRRDPHIVGVLPREGDCGRNAGEFRRQQRAHGREHYRPQRAGQRAFSAVRQVKPAARVSEPELYLVVGFGCICAECDGQRDRVHGHRWWLPSRHRGRP